MRRITWLATLAAGAATMPALLARAAEPIQSYDTYRSWFVACDNGLRCEAKGFDDSSSGTEMGVQRDAGPNGVVRVWISSDRPFDRGDVRIDGRPIDLSGAGWEVTRSDNVTSVATDHPAAARALIARLRSGSRISVGGEATIPLDGFSAAMLRIDARQGRAGGATALIAAGRRAASSVPPAPALPRIAYHPITARLARGEKERLIEVVHREQQALFAKEECEQQSVADPDAFALDRNSALVFLPCLTGAYQSSSLAFIASRHDAGVRRLVVPMPYRGNDGEGRDIDVFTEPSFDPKTGALLMFAKGRSLADCGMSASWIWDGAAFRLAEMNVQKACGGVEPGDWPTLFRSRH